MRQIVVALIVISLFGILSWSANFRVTHAAEAATYKGIDAVSAALVPTIMRPGRDLNTLCQQVATTGGYTEVSVTDTDGKVLGSSNKSLLGTKIELPKPLPAHTVKQGDNLVKGIETVPGADNFLGALVVKWARE